MTTRPLPTDWTLTFAGSPPEHVPPKSALFNFPATVPGCVHTDLITANVIPDPYPGHNEHASHWIGWCDWKYATTIELTQGDLNTEHLEVVFDGLDTVATIRLNDEIIGESQNMHVRCRFDLKQHGRVGDNELSVTFKSPRVAAHLNECEIGGLPIIGSGSNPQLPHTMLRKMACNFGWDWGPQLLTSGIWRPCRIEAWETARIADVRPLVMRADEDVAEVDVRVDVEGEAEVQATLRDPDGKVVAEGSSRLTVEKPRLWWPVGYGDQPLYELTIELLDSDRVLDSRTHSVGLRTAKLVTTPDAEPVEALGQGETFQIEVNGQRVFCKGANWIPDDCFPHRVTPERYAERVDQAVSANMNMLRIWGGGLYEDHAFYEHCDRVGMLVWQDFLLACGCYPEEEPMRSLIEHEARDNVARLARHPSLVLWNGCNENIWGTFDWPEPWVSIREEGKRTWGLGYYLDVLPQIVQELDPSRSYWPGSPYSGSMERHPNANEYGNRHMWDVWNGHGDYRNYLGHFPRFASEFGYQGPPTIPTLDEAVSPDGRSWLSADMHQHNKQKVGQQRALDRIADDFNIENSDSPERFDDVWFLATLQQCRALTLGCEWFRALSPWCSGALYWQLNDCWPVVSWAAIDGSGRPKMLLEATRRFFRPRLLTILPSEPISEGKEADAYSVYLHNDSKEAWSTRVRIRKINLEAATLEEHEADLDVAPRATATLRLPESFLGTPGELLLAETPDDRAWHFFGRDREIDYPVPDLEVAVEQTATGRRLQVTSKTTIRDLYCLNSTRAADLARTRQGVHLLPGETAAFDLDDSADPKPRLISANHVCHSMTRG